MPTTKDFAFVIKIWLVLAFIATMASGTVYTAVQQVLRSGANDPQIQIAEDAARALSNGATAQSLVPSNITDLTRDLSPFIIIFNDSLKMVASSAKLNSKIPVPPAGVFEYTKATGEDRITWQPQPGVRIASIITRFNGANASGYVLAGRSLKEVEIRESNLLRLVFAGWAATLVVGLGISLILFKKP